MDYQHVKSSEPSRNLLKMCECTMNRLFDVMPHCKKCMYTTLAVMHR